MGLALAVVLAGVSLVLPVDERAYTEWPAYAATVAALDRQAAKVAIAHGPLEAGFGRASLTPNLQGSTEDWRTGTFPGLSLAGFSERRGAPATGVRDRLWVKSIALRAGGQTVVITSVDALIVPPSVTELLAKRVSALGLTRAQLFLTATHTHSGPGGWGRDWASGLVAGPAREGVPLWMAQRIESSIGAALDDLQPASLGKAWVDIPELVKGKARPHPGFPVLAFRQANGRTALIGSYAAHPVILSADNLELGGDYPGAWQRTMEEKGFTLALFAAGPMAGQSPALAHGSFSEAESFGIQLADRLLPALQTIRYEPQTELATLGMNFALPDPQVRIADTWRIRPWLARAILPLERETFLQAIRIGRTILISTPGDYDGELALALETALQGTGWTPILTSFNGDYIGYVMAADGYHDGSYESRVMSFFGPGIGEFMNDIAARMAKALAAPASH